MFKKMVILFLVLQISCLLFAGVKKINYQGKLMDNLGSPIDTAGATIAVTFRLYNEANQEVWTATQGVVFDQGLFNVTLDNLDSLSFDKQYTLGIQVAGDTEEMNTRHILGAATYALGSLGDFNVGGNINSVGNVVAGGNINSVGNVALGHRWNDGLSTANVNIGKPDASGGFAGGSAYINFKDSLEDGANKGTGILFNTHQYGVATKESMRIASNGNVGIGTINPLTKLHIAGVPVGENPICNDGNDRPGIGITGQYPQIMLMSKVVNWGHGPSITFGSYDVNSNTNKKQWTIGTSGIESTFLDIGYYAGTDPNPHHGLRNWAGGQTMMTLLNNGNVGIGTTNPVATLHVFNKRANGDSYSSITLGSSPDPGRSGSAELNFVGYGTTGDGAYIDYSRNNGRRLVFRTIETDVNGNEGGHIAVMTLDSTGYLTARGYLTHSPDIRKEKGIKDPKPKDYLKWALEDAKKTIMPYDSIPSLKKKIKREKRVPRNKKSTVSNEKQEPEFDIIEEEVLLDGPGYFNTQEEVDAENKKYSKDISKIAIGVANWAEEADQKLDEIDELKKQVELLTQEVNKLKKK